MCQVWSKAQKALEHLRFVRIVPALEESRALEIAEYDRGLLLEPEKPFYGREDPGRPFSAGIKGIGPRS